MLNDKATRTRSKPREALPIQTIKRLVEKVNLELHNKPIVLRIYDRDPAACRKETYLHRLVQDSVPVPEILHIEPDGIDGVSPFALMQFVEDITLRKLKASRNVETIGQAAYSAGQTLAAIGRYAFPDSGWLGPDLMITGKLVNVPNPIPQLIDICLASPNLQGRMNEEMREQLHDLVWSWVERFACLDEDRHLVHCDFNSPNLLVQQIDGRWTVSAVIDWEFAVLGSSLFDIGNFLRYERALRPIREPHFSLGYMRAGGTLPDDWQRMARVIDLTSLCEILTREPLPEDVTTEVLDLIQTTIEDRDPA